TPIRFLCRSEASWATWRCSVRPRGAWARIRIDEPHRLEPELDGNAINLDRRARYDDPLEVGPETREVHAHATAVDLQDERASGERLDLAGDFYPTVLVGRDQHRRGRDGWRLRRRGRGRRCRHYRWRGAAGRRTCIDHR